LQVGEIATVIKSDSKSVSRSLGHLLRRNLAIKIPKSESGYYRYMFNRDFEFKPIPTPVSLPAVATSVFNLKELDIQMEAKPDDAPAHYKRPEKKKAAPRDVRMKKTANIAAYNLPPFITIDEAVGWERITMINRLKSKLIEEHHPILNIIIEDYKRILSLNQEGAD